MKHIFISSHVFLILLYKYMYEEEWENNIKRFCAAKNILPYRIPPSRVSKLRNRRFPVSLTPTPQRVRHQE